MPAMTHRSIRANAVWAVSWLSCRAAAECRVRFTSCLRTARYGPGWLCNTCDPIGRFRRVGAAEFHPCFGNSAAEVSIKFEIPHAGGRLPLIASLQSVASVGRLVKKKKCCTPEVRKFLLNGREEDEEFQGFPLGTSSSFIPRTGELR
jgi:hypothetical protein